MEALLPGPEREPMNALQSDIPSHIPPQLVHDIDIYDLSAVDEDVHLAWKRLQDFGEIIWTPRNGGHWIVTNGALTYELFKDHERLSSKEISVPRGTNLYPIIPTQSDEPEHSAYRQIIQPAFMPREVQRYSEEARKLAVELIEEFKPIGECEFISDSALKLPLIIFLRIVDLPLEDRETLHGYTEVMTRESDPQVRVAAYQNTVDYLKYWIGKRRAEPGDDLLSQAVNCTVLGRPATEDEVLGLGANMLFGGLDTVASMMGFIMRFLAGHPEHRRWILEHPDKMRHAVEELLRRHGVANIARVAKYDIEIGGATVKEDEIVYLITCQHGLDDRVCPNPLEVDFNRPTPFHGTFGNGIHRCPGSNLARNEIRVMLEEWLPRIPDFRIKRSDKAVAQSGPVNGVLYLPLQWDVS